MAERLGGCLRTAFYAWWLSTSLGKAKLRENWLWMYIIRIFMSRKAACCGQADLNIKASFFKKFTRSGYVNPRLFSFIICYVLLSRVFFFLVGISVMTQPVTNRRSDEGPAYRAEAGSFFGRGSNLPCRGRACHCHGLAAGGRILQRPACPYGDSRALSLSRLRS